MQYQMHLGIGFLEGGNHLGQCVARLGVGGGNGELAFVTLAELLGQTLDVAGIQQHALNNGQQFLARVGQAKKAFALAYEQLDAQFVFQILDVFADPDCEVYSALATSVRLKFCRTVSRMMRSCWKFMRFPGGGLLMQGWRW
jgi:hypothetical protein